MTHFHPLLWGKTFGSNNLQVNITKSKALGQLPKTICDDKSTNISNNKYVDANKMDSNEQFTESDVDSGLQTESGYPESQTIEMNADKGESPLLAKSPKVSDNVPEDNIELFTPMKALNFMDATDSDIQQNSEVEDDNEDDGPSSIETTHEKIEFAATNNQGLRIIEGHASPLDDKSGQAFSFSTIPQTQSTGFIVPADRNPDMFTDSPNLYDSLDEHEDGDVPRSPHRIKYSPVHNAEHNTRKVLMRGGPGDAAFKQRSLQKSSPNSKLNPRLVQTDGSPGEVQPNPDLLKRPDDIFEWSLPNQFNVLSFNESNISSEDHNFSNQQVPFGVQTYAQGDYNAPNSHSNSEHQYSMVERHMPSGTHDQGSQLANYQQPNLRQDLRRENVVLPNQNIYSPISDADSQDFQHDFVPESFHSDRGAPVQILEQVNPDHDQFQSLPNMNQEDGAPKRPVSHPQKPSRQNLMNQRGGNQPEAKLCSRQQKHEQRQNINNNSGMGARAKTGSIQTRQGVPVRPQVHPKTRPNAQGGNVQEKQKPLVRNQPAVHPPTNQPSREIPVDMAIAQQGYARQQHGGNVRERQPQPRLQTNPNVARNLNNIHYENRIAGVGQDDVITRANFTGGVPDSDDQSNYYSDNQQSVTMRRSGLGQQREATVGYQNNDQYLPPSYPSSDIGSEELNTDVRTTAGSNNNRHYHPDVSQMVTHGNIRSPQTMNVSNQSIQNCQGDISVDILGMEEVRAHLHSMLRSANNIHDVPVNVNASPTPSELIMEHPSIKNRNLDPSLAIGGRLQEEVPDISESFPSFSSKIFTDMNSANSRTESSIQNENQYLRDALERERYRRKHCEEQIQQLNSKLLESQQQLAVSISTDKKKDIMIEQLDKQLAKVVEGWKNRELEKDEYLKVLMKEKGKIEESFQKQQLVINNFDKNMNDIMEKLRQEKQQHAEDITKLDTKIKEQTKLLAETEESLAGEKEKCHLMSMEGEQLKESRELAEKRAQVAQDRLHHEQDEFYRREQELLSKIDEVKDANLKVIQMERRKTEEEAERVIELEDKIRIFTTDLKKLEFGLDSATREKESMKVEMSIMEAKYESSSRKLESDLHAQMEKEISEQIEDITEKMESTVNEIQEKHRQQVIELQKRQQIDLEKQLYEFHEQVMGKEDELRRQIVDGENQLREYRKENTSLKNIKQKLESQRMEVLTKLQYMMQSQWNEAVTLLVNTPVRRRQLSAVSSVNPVQTDGNQTVNPSLNLSLLTQHLPKTSSPGRDGLTTNFGQYIEQEGGVSNMEPLQQNTTQTARVEAYLNSLPTSTSAMNPLPQQPASLPIMPHYSAPAPSQQSYKPASHNVPLHHPNTSVLNQSLKSDSLYTRQQTTDTNHLVDNYNTRDVTLSKYDHVSDKKTSAVNNDSLSNETIRTLDSYSNALRQPNLASVRPVDSSASQYVRPKSAGNSPREDKYRQFVQHRSNEGSNLLRRQHSDEEPNHFRSSTRSNTSSASKNSVRSSRSVHPPDLDNDLMQTLSQDTLPSDSALHHLLHQRIENYLTNQNTNQSKGPTPAIMIRPPHQQTRPIRNENTIRSANQMEETMNSSYQTERDFDNGSIRGEDHLTLHDLNSFSPPIKQSRSRSPTTDQNSSTGGRSSEEGRNTVRLNSDYSVASSRVEDHQFRQSELQHYLKMLLEKSPVSTREEPVHDITDDIDTSRDLTLDLDLNDTEQAAQLNQELLRLQQLREKQGKAKNRTESSQQDTLSTSTGSLPGVIPPDQIAEISQLLSQYQQQLNQDGGTGQRSNQQSGGSNNPLTSLLVSALNNLPTRNQHPNGGKGKPTSKLSPRTNQTRKPASTTHRPTLPNKETTQDGGTDRSHVGGTKKTDKKTVAVKPNLQKNKFWK